MRWFVLVNGVDHDATGERMVSFGDGIAMGLVRSRVINRTDMSRGLDILVFVSAVLWTGRSVPARSIAC